jgi:hypothetical protein
MKLFSKKNVKIKPNQTFLHEKDRYEKGVVYKVPINLARYFDRNGWLEGGVQVNPPEVTDLDIQDVHVRVHWDAEQMKPETK